MQSLFIWIEKRKKFSVKKLLSYLPEIKGASNIQDMSDILPHALFDWSFDFENDSTIAELHDNLETISTQGTGRASLQLALEIQRHEKMPLRIFNDGYDFHFSIKGLSLAEIEQKIRESYFDEEAKALDQKLVEAA